MSNHFFEAATLPISRYGRQPANMHSHPNYHGFCHSCCHPIAKCCCGHRECQKIAKELLAKPSEKETKGADAERMKNVFSMIINPMHAKASSAETVTAGEGTSDTTHLIRNVSGMMAGISSGKVPIGSETAIIGGGCCVHLSIEYMPSQPTTNVPSLVAVLVTDSEGTFLGWGKLVSPGYHIKEGIITTNPGAQLVLYVINAIARVRWCEIFSC